jgi:acyl-CoA synthetase (AMP-forming)/AMP-acid ligase II
MEITEEEVLGETMPVFANRYRSLREILEASARDFGDDTYYVFDDGRRATFAENAGHAAAVAAALQDRYGITKGDRVAILAANWPEWIQAFWGTVSLGGIVVAMNGWWTSGEIDHGLELTEPALLIVDRRRAERLDGDPGIPTIVMEDDFSQLTTHAPDAALPDVPLDEDDPAAILFTSGTTARPKGAITTHRCFSAFISMSFAVGAIDAVRFPPTEPAPKPINMSSSPLFHVSGLHASAVTGLAAGATSVWTTGRFDPEKVFALTEQEGISRWGGVTTQVWRLIEHPKLHDYDVSSVRWVGGGGSVWSPALQNAVREALPNAAHSVSIGYGLTESSGLATSAPDDLLREHPDSVGRAIPTVQVAIRDDNDDDLPEGVEGEVCLRGPMVIPGYWRDPEATRATVRPGRWLRTGDIGRLVDGVLFLSSRQRDMIIRGGENISPIEIENRLEAHPDIREAAVFGVDHPRLGQEVKAVVVPAPGVELTAEGLSAFVADSLAYYKVPSHWDIRTEPLPRNATGKVLKRVLTGESESTFIEE